MARGSKDASNTREGKEQHAAYMQAREEARRRRASFTRKRHAPKPKNGGN